MADQEFKFRQLTLDEALVQVVGSIQVSVGYDDEPNAYELARMIKRQQFQQPVEPMVKKQVGRRVGFDPRDGSPFMAHTKRFSQAKGR